MKVLMVNKFLYPRGGAETYLFRIGSCLHELGHEVQYFGMKDEKNTVGNMCGLETRPMDFRSKGASRFLYPFHILYSTEARRKIRQIAEEFEPDIVHLHNINYQLTPSVIDGIAKLGIPMVQTVHDFQMLCPNHMMLNPGQKAPCARCLQGTKWNCARYRCIHDSLIKSILGSMEGALYRRRRNYEQVSRFICPSRFLESMLLQDRRFAGKTVVMHNFASACSAPENVEKGEYVLYFGRLAQEKDMEGFLEACRRCPEIPFIVAGSGPLECLFENGPPNVQYVGFQSGDALNRLIAQAKFSVYLPIWYENCPLAVLESQALGTPVLANRIGGIPELIEDGQTGVLIDSFTPENYAAQIRKLYLDQAGLERMSENCRRNGGSATLMQYCNQLLDIYAAILKQGA